MNAHIHAENMRLYAEDATKTDKPWELWEFISFGMEDYQTLESNPNWDFATEYRRKIKKANPRGAERAALYREFCEWCNTVPYLDLDPRLHTHGGRIEDGGYISDIATAKAFADWQAARRATAAPQSQADALDAEPMWLQVDAEVRYWEDATVNGDEDTEGDLIPLKQGNRWVPVIRLADGFIAGWPQGVSADIHYKVCDQGEYFLINAALQRISKYRSYYVPDMLSVGDDGYGDYIILKVNGDGFIEGWTRPVIDEEMWEPIDRAAIAAAKEKIE